MEEIAVIAGIAGTVVGAAVGYGAFRARLTSLETAYKEFRENISKEMGRLQGKCNTLENKMSELTGELKGARVFDPRRSGQHPKP